MAALEKESKRELLVKGEELEKALAEKKAEDRLAMEEMELRLNAMCSGDESKSKLVNDLETKLVRASSELAKAHEKLQQLEKSCLDKTNEAKSQLIIAEQKLADSLTEKNWHGSVLEAIKEAVAEDQGDDLSNLESVKKRVCDIMVESQKFKAQWEESESEISKLRQEVAEKVENLKELESENVSLSKKLSLLEETVAGLKGEVESAHASLKLSMSESQAKADEDDHVRSSLGELESKIETLKAEKCNLQGELAEANDSLAKEKNEAEMMRKELETMRIGLEESKMQRSSQEESKFEEKDKEIANLRLECSEYQKTVEAGNADKEKLDKLLGDMKAKLAVTISAKKKLDAAVKAKQQKIDELNETISKNNKDHEDAVMGKERQLEKFEEQLKLLMEEHEDQTKKCDRLKSDAEKQESHGLEMQQKSERLEKVVGERDNAIEALEKKLQDLVTSVDSEHERLEARAADAEQLLTQAQSDIISLEEELSTAKAENFQLRAVKELEEQMIKYQKELQEQVKNSEQREEELKSVVEQQARWVTFDSG